ncbi:MAG: hypothetical protein JW861_12950, partial [Bacteroidales bacterium]|nr:hypothetical protein [Bacteroidales bacterium]
MKSSRMILVLFIFAAGITTGWNRTENPADSIIYEVPTMIAVIDTDGRLEEPCWSGACPIRQFYHTEKPLPLALDARVLAFFDGENLVFGFDLPAIAREAEPERCYLSDEFDLRRIPNVTITLDPEHRHGVYYKFIIDPAGRRQDLKVDDESWTTPWTAAIKQENGRFSAEVRIPVHAIFNRQPAGEFWGFNISFTEASGKETCHSTPMDLKTSDAENFGHLLFSGTLTDQQAGELKSSLPAIHSAMKENRLAVNNALCGPEMKQIPEEIENLQVGGQLSLKDGTHITCLGMDNQPVIRSDHPFFYEKYNHPELQRLRNQYSLHEIIAPGKNDFEQILLLNEWLVKHVPFGSPPPIMPQALHVLHHGLNGQPFYCTFMSFTLMQMYCSLGFTARKITSVGHGTLDVWSNYWRKWMQIDPSRNSY